MHQACGKSAANPRDGTLLSVELFYVGNAMAAPQLPAWLRSAPPSLSAFVDKTQSIQPGSRRIVVLRRSSAKSGRGSSTTEREGELV